MPHELRSFPTLLGGEALLVGDIFGHARATSMNAKCCPAIRRRCAVHRKAGAGVFRRDVGNGEHAEIRIGERVYRVRLKELA